jgi:hypothetical protein
LSRPSPGQHIAVIAGAWLPDAPRLAAYFTSLPSGVEIRPAGSGATALASVAARSGHRVSTGAGTQPATRVVAFWDGEDARVAQLIVRAHIGRLLSRIHGPSGVDTAPASLADAVRVSHAVAAGDGNVRPG